MTTWILLACFAGISQAHVYPFHDKTDGAYAAPISLRVMTFNTWMCGKFIKNGMEKLATHIKLVDPDIVALQEIQNATIVDQLSRLIGKPWNGIFHPDGHHDTAIMTKHETRSYTASVVSVQIKITSSLTVHFWSAHLAYMDYGPYAAFNKLVTDPAQIMNCEKDRKRNMQDLLADKTFQGAVKAGNSVPVIIAGDFNSPSHLDWNNRTRDWHGGWEFQWPATALLQNEAGFIDAFRKVHPDVREIPGITWSTILINTNLYGDYTIPEPQDRIDFIFYRSRLLNPIRSFTYKGDQPLQPIPHQNENDYPSDHYAVVTDFDVIFPKE